MEDALLAFGLACGAADKLLWELYNRSTFPPFIVPDQRRTDLTKEWVENLEAFIGRVVNLDVASDQAGSPLALRIDL